MHEKVSRFFIKFINLVSWGIVIGVIGSLIALSSVLLTHVANQWRLTGHLDASFGFSIIAIVFIVVWVPIWFTLYVRES